MINIKKIIGSMPIIIFFAFLANLIYAQEPNKPDVSTIFDKEKEAKIQELTEYASQSAIEKIKASEFFYNEDELNKAIFVAFKDRKEEAIAIAMHKLTLPRVKLVDDKKIVRGNDLFIAKKILQVFPDEALESITNVYQKSDALTKSNIIQALGSMSAGGKVREMLISALDDKTFCEEENPEMEGEPMRICDVAYNQLVLRYQIKDVLRTIGPSHSLEQRDYHIGVLKGKL